MAQRNTYREDEELEEQINFRDILRVGKYLKPYMAQVARILVVVISMSCIVVAVPYLTKIMIDEAIPMEDIYTNEFITDDIDYTHVEEFMDSIDVATTAARYEAE